LHACWGTYREGAILLEVTTARLKLAEILKKIFDDREGDPEGYNGFVSTLGSPLSLSGLVSTI